MNNPLEQHYTLEQIAERWAVSVDTVRRIFSQEPGVLTIGAERSGGKRREKVTLRVPESVLARVHTSRARVA